MSFNDDADIRGGKVSRRGRNTAIAGGGGVIGIIAVVLISQLTGVDLTGLLGGGGPGGTVEERPLTECETGADADTNLDCRMLGAATSLDTFWTGTVNGYRQPELVLFEQATPTGCGTGTSATGPFYCPPDETVYIDTSFFAELESRFGANGGPLGQLYVVAHEWGHHIQHITGRMDGLDLRDTGPTSDGVRLELQADCYAGAWVGAAETTTDASGRPFLDPLTDADIEAALSAAEAVGDDHIQETLGGGQVNPETWTHGSSEQRQRWFTTGRTQGVGSCDTFATDRL